MTEVKPEPSIKTPLNPLISVIMPTFNYGRFIDAAIDCLQAQTYANWECIVVDDGSTDNTRAVVARRAAVDPRVNYIYQDNQKQAVAKNTALTACSGEFIQFLDSDDLIESRKFERQSIYLLANPTVDIVYGDMRLMDEGGLSELRYGKFGEDKSWMPYVSGAGEEMLRYLIVNNTLPINAPLVRRAVVESVGDFDPPLPPLEDWDYWIRCALSGKRFQFENLEGTMALVRVHSASSSKQTASFIAAERRLREKLNAILPAGDLRKLNCEVAARLEGTLGVEELAKGRRRQAIHQFLRAARASSEARVRLRWWVCALSAMVGSARQIETIAGFSPAQSWARLSHRSSAES